MTIPTDQPAVISATVTYQLTANAGGGAVFVQGEPVKSVRVATTMGGAAQVTYITASGREVPITLVR